MATQFAIYSVALRQGLIGMCPMPGRNGDYSKDLASVLAWSPKLVVSMTPASEMAAFGADGLASDLESSGVTCVQLPVSDYRVPSERQSVLWDEVSKEALGALDRGQNVLFHCNGGCGRSGMGVLRMMVESGEDAYTALLRLRIVRPCAVETDAQFDWAIKHRVPSHKNGF